MSQTAARLFWPGEDPLGKRVRSALDGPWHVVAGVVGDVSVDGLDAAPVAQVYAPLAGVDDAELGENVVGLFRMPSVVASVTAPVTVVGGLMRETLRAIDPQLALGAWEEADPLTERERNVLRLAGEGRTSAQIGEELHLSEGTVRNYLSEAIGKLGAANRVDAARKAREKGWL